MDQAPAPKARRPAARGFEPDTDILVHSQDIAIPLRRRLDVPTEAAAIAATQVWSSQDSRKGRLLSRVFRPVPYRSYRLIATDTEWAVGDGPEIRGPILAILLLLTGRTGRLHRARRARHRGARGHARLSPHLGRRMSQAVFARNVGSSSAFDGRTPPTSNSAQSGFSARTFDYAYLACSFSLWA